MSGILYKTGSLFFITCQNSVLKIDGDKVMHKRHGFSKILLLSTLNSDMAGRKDKMYIELAQKNASSPAPHNIRAF